MGFFPIRATSRSGVGCPEVAMIQIRKRKHFVGKNHRGLRFFIENRGRQDAGGKLQNSQITLDMLLSVDKTCPQIEQAWLSDLPPNESSVVAA